MLLNTRNVPTSRLTMLKAVRFNRKAPSSCCACPVRSDGVTASTRPPSPLSMRSASAATSTPSAAVTPMRWRVPAPPNRDWASAMSVTRARRPPEVPQRWKSMNAPTRSVRARAPSRTWNRSPTAQPMAVASSGVTATQPRRRTAAPVSASGESPESASQKSWAGASRSTPSSRTNVSGFPSTATVGCRTGVNRHWDGLQNGHQTLAHGSSLVGSEILPENLTLTNSDLLSSGPRLRPLLPLRHRRRCHTHQRRRHTCRS